MISFLIYTVGLIVAGSALGYGICRALDKQDRNGQ